jgi:hypothetical protein
MGVTKGFVRLRKASAFFSVWHPSVRSIDRHALRTAVCVTVERMDEKGPSIAALFFFGSVSVVAQEEEGKKKERAFWSLSAGYDLV